MNRRYENHDDYDRKYTSKEFSCLNYFSKKSMKKMYPDHGYIVIGAVGEGLKTKAATFVFEEIEKDIFTLNYKKFQYGIDGYFDCGNNEMVAVIKNKQTRNLMLLFIVMLMIAGLLLGGYQLLKDQNPLDPNITEFHPNIELPENADPNRIAIPGFDEITMLADTDELYLALWNPETNPCYFQFEIILEEEEKTVFESGLVPPGKAITTVKLNEKIAEGTHPIRIQMNTYSLEDGETPMNSGTSKTTIYSIKVEERK